MKTKIKICGITRLSDALKAIDAGVWAIGFIFTKESKRYIPLNKAKAILDQLPSSDVKIIGVFVNEDEEIVRHIHDELRLDFVQLHGDENTDYCEKLSLPYVKVISSEDDRNLFQDAEYYLLDSRDGAKRGGTGKLANWNLASSLAKSGRLILAGGLNLDNIEHAISVTGCFAYDMNSGLESEPGIKIHEKISELKKVINDEK